MIRKIKIMFYKMQFERVSESLADILCGLQITSAAKFIFLIKKHDSLFESLVKHAVIPYGLTSAVRSIGYNRKWPSFKKYSNLDQIKEINLIRQQNRDMIAEFLKSVNSQSIGSISSFNNVQEKT